MPSYSSPTPPMMPHLPTHKTADTRTRYRSLSLFCVCLLALAVFGLAFTPLRGSQDEWWHLKTGQWIWENAKLPTNDIFTYTGEKMRWYNHEWLSQLLFYGAYLTADATGFQGMSGVIFFKALIVTAAFLVVAGLARQRGISWPAASFVALVAADIARRTIHPRPPVFSYLLLGIFLLVLTGWKQGTVRLRHLWVLVLVTAVWANLHGMVLLAIIATGAFTLGQVFDNYADWCKRNKISASIPLEVLIDRRVLTLAGLTVATILACMLQPSGYHLFLLGRNFTADPLLQNIIGEMQPTPRPFRIINPAQPLSFSNIYLSPPGFWTFWVALGGLVMLLLRNRMRLNYSADYLLVGFFAYQAVAHWRLLPLFAVACAPCVAGLLRSALATLTERWRNLESPIFTLMLGGAVLWFNFTVNENDTFIQRNRQMLKGEVANLFDYPAPLMEYLKQADLPDNMLSDSNYCGYAIWHLSPEKHKLFTDARFDLFGSRFIRLERNIFYAAEAGDRMMVYGPKPYEEVFTEDWHGLLDRFNINFIVFRPVDRPRLHEALVQSRRWRIVYYYIPPGSNQQEWPYNGNYVWVRNSLPDAAAIAKRSEAIFARQFPDEILPSKMADIAGTPGNDAPTTASWRR